MKPVNAYIAGEIASLEIPTDGTDLDYVRIKLTLVGKETKWLSIAQSDVPKFAELLSDIYDREERR